jgi:hypothetical protein
VPVEDRPGRDQERSRGTKLASGAMRAPARTGRNGAGPLWRCSTASWWRKTMDLGVLREAVHMVDVKGREQPADELVEEREGHGRASWLSASELVKREMRIIGPFRFVFLVTGHLRVLRLSRASWSMF